MTANYFIWLIVSPSQLILIAALLSAVFWRRPVGRKLAGLTVALLLFFGLAPIGSLLIKPLETRFEIPGGLSGVDGIIVLSGSEQVVLSELYSQPQINAAGDRLTTFLALAVAHPEARLVYTGGSQTRAARALILGAGVEPSRIVFDEEARNTCESAPAVRKIAAPIAGERWLLVTSASHLPRAVACFRAADWDVIPYPTDFRSGSTPWSYDLVANLGKLDLAAHEWLGLVYYRLRGYTDDLFPAPSRL